MEQNFSIQQVLQRYRVTEFPNSISEELENLKVDREFILALANLFEDEKVFCESAFQKFSLDIIIDYIRRTHSYYINNKLPEIAQSIEILLADYSDNHSLLHILHQFYHNYSKSLVEHIQVEEKMLLPYIEYLVLSEKKGINLLGFFTRTKSYSLQKFIEHHHDTEIELRDVQKSIIYYNPPTTNQTPYRILLSQLETFEKDLAVHALIEDKVLIPRSLTIETDVSLLLSEKSKLN